MKKDYMSRLSPAARWLLLPEDAAEVIADYKDIANGRSDEELLRDIGDPVQAAKLVADQKEYRHWLRAFTVLAVCVLFVLALTTQLVVMMSFLFATRLTIEPDAILFYLAEMERERAVVAAVGVVVAGVCLC